MTNDLYTGVLDLLPTATLQDELAAMERLNRYGNRDQKIAALRAELDARSAK